MIFVNEFAVNWSIPNTPDEIKRFVIRNVQRRSVMDNYGKFYAGWRSNLPTVVGLLALQCLVFGVLIKENHNYSRSLEKLK